MKRDIDALGGRQFDVLVVGGGVHGACVVRDAALRGLSVALIEQCDYSSATSHNSLKTIHGGIRYLQHLNIKRAVESIREQDVLLRIAPHLVQPLRFMMPCYGWMMRGPVATALGVVLFEILGFFTRLAGGHLPRWPAGSVHSASGALALAPGLDTRKLTGAASWLDAQVSLADKAVLQMLEHASENHAVVANYVRADALSFTADGRRVTGVTATDTIAGKNFDIAARLVINAAGPWANHWVNTRIAHRGDESGNTALADSRLSDSRLTDSLRVGLVKSMNLLIDAPAADMAIGVKSRLQSDSKVDAANRLYFAIPWLGKTLIGTTHYTHRADSRELENQPGEVDAFVDEFNAAYPAMNLFPDDVLYCYQGLTPGDDAVDADGAKLHHSKVIDHQLVDKLAGLISIIGIKWTTARRVAEHAVDIASAHLNAGGACLTRTTPIPDYPATAHHTESLNDEQLRQFVLSHVQHTQAFKLDDIVLRRTNDLVLGTMTSQRVRLVIDTLATHFSWSMSDQREQLDSLLASGLGPRTRAALIAEFTE